MVAKNKEQQAQEEPEFIESIIKLGTRKRPLKKDYMPFFCNNCESDDIVKIYTIEEVTLTPNPKIFGKNAETQSPFERKVTQKYRCEDCKIENFDLGLVAKQQEERSYGGRGPYCFIATAVYGDENAPEVQTLREFRDDVLKQSGAGAAVVNFYYSGAGKKVADFIKNRLPSSIQFIKKGLDYLVEKYSAKNN